jgi:integrase
MGQKLDDKSVRELLLPASGNKIHYDSEVAGFGVRLTAKGARSYILNYRMGRRERRVTIGSASVWRCIDARKRAKKLKLQLAANKVDPLADRDAKLVSQLAKRYLEEHVSGLRESTRIDYQRTIDKEILPALGHLRVTEVTDDDVTTLHRAIAKRAPYRANRVLAVLSSMFAQAIRPWRWCTVNPCKGVRRAPEHERTRFLGNGELARLLDALTAFEDQQVADVLRMAMLTGARIGEICSKMQWKDIRGDSWTKPHLTTKQRKEHTVPLTPPVLELLARQSKGSEQVFPGTPGAWRGKLDRAWRKIRKEAELGDFRIHDLRHNYASTLVNAGYSLPVIGALLGHSKAGTTQRYSHLYRGTLTEAAEHAAKAIANAGKPANASADAGKLAAAPVPFRRQQ